MLSSFVGGDSLFGAGILKPTLKATGIAIALNSSSWLILIYNLTYRSYNPIFLSVLWTTNCCSNSDCSDLLNQC